MTTGRRASVHGGTGDVVSVGLVTAPPSTRPSRAPEGLGRRLSGPVVALVLAAGLVLVTAGVVRGGAVIRLDDRLLALTPGRGGGPQVIELVALAVVDLATPVLSVAVTCAVTFAVCLRTGRWAPLAVAGPALVLVSGAVLLGKGVISRTAPDLAGMPGGDGSYPSGHTATALVCAGIAAELVSRLRPAHRRLAWSAAAVWTALVVTALLWLHFHWVSDVVGSVCLASLVLWLLLRWPARLGARLGAPPPAPSDPGHAGGGGDGGGGGGTGGTGPRPPWLDRDRSGAR